MGPVVFYLHVRVLGVSTGCFCGVSYCVLFQGRALRADGCVVRGHLRPRPGGAAQEAAGR